MNSEYLNRSRISTAYALQKEQNFGKDTVHQSSTCDKSFLHVVLHIYESKYLVKHDKSIEKNHEAFRRAMNKEDKQDYVLTFPAYIKDYIPDLWLTRNVLVQIPGKKDRVIFDASFCIHAHSHPYNSCVSNEHEPNIIFGGAWT
jgi:hypothetical protein